MTTEHANPKAPSRAGADRLCLWRLCGGVACVRARACRGEPRDCTTALRLWLQALARAEAPGLEAAPLVLTKEEARQLALFRSAVEQAEVKPMSIASEAEADLFRQDLSRRLLALSRKNDHASPQDSG